MIRLLARCLPPALTRGVQSYMALDLWQALGRDPQAFDATVRADGWFETWARTLHEVRAIVHERHTRLLILRPCLQTLVAADGTSFTCDRHHGHDDHHIDIVTGTTWVASEVRHAG